MSNGETFASMVERHWAMLRKRGGRAVSHELTPPAGQAGRWYDDVADQVPTTARHVARQVARLCGDDSTVSVPLRSLADAVGMRDSLGRPRSYTETGLNVLEAHGWLHRTVTGRGRGASTVLDLLPGDRPPVAWAGID